MSITALIDARHLTVLDLSNNSLSADESIQLADVVQQNIWLEELVLKYNNLKSSVIVIFQSLLNTESLRILDIENNDIDETAGESLADVIRNTELEELYISDNNFGKGLLSVVKGLQSISSL